MDFIQHVYLAGAILQGQMDVKGVDIKASG